MGVEPLVYGCFTSFYLVINFRFMQSILIQDLLNPHFCFPPA